MQSEGPLSGLKVLDLTQAMAGPIATMILGDLGAEIIKVEPPGGDQTRSWAPPYISGISSYFLSANRNKKSIAIDLKKPGAVSVLEKIVRSCDVFIENFRPGTMEKLGLDYDHVKGMNERIIYCSLSGFGHTGPAKDWPGYDLTVLAFSGLLSLNSEEGRAPIKFGVPIADITAGLFADISILSALHERSVSGKGQYIDLSMLDANFYVLTHQAMSYFATGNNPRLLGSAHSSIAPYQVFPTSDGFIAAAVGTEKLWAQFCKTIDRTDLMEDLEFSTNSERIRNRERLVKEISSTFSRFRTADLFDRLMKAGIPAAPTNTIEEAAKSDQIAAREMVTEVEAPYGKIPLLGSPFRMSRTPGSVRTPPPRLGENTEEILRDAGLDPGEIRELRNAGIVQNMQSGNGN